MNHGKGQAAKVCWTFEKTAAFVEAVETGQPSHATITQ